MSTKIDHRQIDGIIKRHLKELRKPGVLTARPGFKMTGGIITDKPAVVVTVDKKRKGLGKAQKLPAELGDTPVDVREATGLQRLRVNSPKDFEIVNAHGRAENREPDWKFERNVKTGKLLSETAPLKVSATPAKATDTAAKAATVKSAKSQIPYKPAATPLNPVTDQFTILAYASPDDGFTVLADFLQQTKSSLNIGMYDFTSGDLLKTMEGVLDSGKVSFRMVLDHPPRNPTANQTDDVTRQDLLQAGKTKAAVNWALTRRDPVVDEWIFPSAYHIKVAVRDLNAFWLSSGNFNVSNQPNFAASDPKRGSLKNADRDWHVIVFHADLAKLFNAYIQNDFTIAGPAQTTGDEKVHKVIHKAMTKLKKESKGSAVTSGTNFASSNVPTLGKKKLFSNVQATVQPLLTPDKGTHTSMYVDNVLKLIKSARRRVYMQTQYIHPSSLPPDKDFMLLVQAMSDAHKQGLDVRIILSEFENTPQWVEKLKEFDLDQVLRIQRGVHNKGIVVDTKVVMVSSQNWSGDGTLRNRDAGLIIEQADIADYFEAIFLDDWTKRANVKVVAPAKKS